MICLFIISRNQLFISLISAYFVSRSLTSALILTVILLIFLGDIATYFSKAFRCIIKLLVQALSNFWYKHLVLFNFLRIALIMSHKFLAFLLFIQFLDF